MIRVFIADLHGNFGILPHLRGINPDADEIIIVGDCGVGFSDRDDERFRNYLNSITSKPFIRFIRGNHDSPEKIKTMPGYISDGTVEDGILYVGGAWSIDGVTGVWKAGRTVGVDWWPDEELSHQEWMDIFSAIKPEEIHTVVSHDFPRTVVPRILGYDKRNYETRTGNYLQDLWEMLPNVKLWIGGHYHVSKKFEENGTTFRVLNLEGSDITTC